MKKKKKQGLWSVMEPVMFEIWTGIALAAVSALAYTAGLMFFAYTIYLLTGGESISVFGMEADLVTALISSAVAVVIVFFSRTYSFNVSHMGAFRLEEILRTRISEHLARVPMGWVVSTGTGTVKKVLMDDVRHLHAFVADSTPFIGRSVAAPLSSFVCLLLVDWRLALAGISVLAAGAVVMYFVMQDSEFHRKKYEQSQEFINSAVIEFVQAMPVVRTFDGGSGSFRRYQTALGEYRQALITWTELTGTTARLAMLILSPMPTLVTVSAVGLYLTGAGTLSFPVFIAALLVSTGMADSMMPFMWMMNFIKKSESSAIRIQEVMAVSELPVPENPKEPADGSVEFDNVCFRYEDRDEYALKDVSFKAAEKTVTALVGPSGAGKSTVAKLIPRFWDVESGSIKTGGADVKDILPETLMGHVSIVFQDTFLFHDTIAENIRMAKPGASDEEVVEAAKSAMIHEFIMTLPDGYETNAGDRGVRLSGGQKQRVTIARAILRDAPVVILDEATAFADPENEEELITALASLTENKTVIVIAHRLSSIMNADQILLFDEGLLKEKGTHKELLEMNGKYAKMWNIHEQSQDWGLGSGERQ